MYKCIYEYVMPLVCLISTHASVPAQALICNNQRGGDSTRVSKTSCTPSDGNDSTLPLARPVRKHSIITNIYETMSERRTSE